MKLLDYASKEYVILTTYRRDGTAVPTVVWIAQHKNCLVVTTSKNAGKVKRIRNNSKVTLCESNQSGSNKLTEEYKARGYEVLDEEEKVSGVNAIRNKYGVMGRTMTSGPMENRSIIKITDSTE